MSAVRRCTWPIRTPGSIGRGARWRGVTGGSVMRVPATLVVAAVGPAAVAACLAGAQADREQRDVVGALALAGRVGHDGVAQHAEVGAVPRAGDRGQALDAALERRAGLLDQP